MSDLSSLDVALKMYAAADLDHDVSDADAEDYVLTKDFWHDNIAEFTDEIIHLMTCVHPSSFEKKKPTIQELCDRWGDLVALKAKAMQKAKDLI